MAIDWEPLRQVIDTHERFVISSHVRPDADAVGSELALASVLERLGKQVRIINPSDLPESLLFLDPTGRILCLNRSATAENVLDAEVHIVIDTSSWAQLLDVGRAWKQSSAVKVVIDHHLSADSIGGMEFKDPSAEASGALVFEMCEALGYEISREMVLPLYCAIATDTGWFRFSSTSSRTLRMAARLIDLGAQPDVIYQRLYENYSLARVRLAGCTLGRITLECEGRLAYTWIELADFAATGASPADTDDLVNECLTIKGTECAFIAIEQRNHTIKISLRSRTDLNVAEVAEQFGGGGHRQAAGAILPGGMAQARKRMIEALEAALAK